MTSELVDFNIGMVVGVDVQAYLSDWTEVRSGLKLHPNFEIINYSRKHPTRQKYTHVKCSVIIVELTRS